MRVADEMKAPDLNMAAAWNAALTDLQDKIESL
jgi:hypothetical protein